jgi:cephalosporin-C deacetylase
VTLSGPEIRGFWDGLDRELAGIPLSLRVERDAFYSQPEWDVYRMRYNSADGYRLFAWLSIPSRPREGGFPALLRMPDYASVHDLIYTPLRHVAIVMNATHRGQRHSDSPFQAQYPGLLTEGISDPQAYVLRRVFADGLRAVDALMGQGEAAVGALAVAGTGLGGSLALAAAARRSQVTVVAADTPLALGRPEVLEAGAYPLAELNDYLRVNPHHRSAVLASTAPLDMSNLASTIAAPVLLSLGRRDRGLCPLAFGEELAARLPRCELRVYDGAGEGGGHEHNVVRGRWLGQKLGAG